MGFTNSTDRDWQKWGEENPYYGVLTDAKFLNANLNDDSLSEFFASGESHVDHVFEVARKSISPIFAPARVLDYGCGVGRLVVPFAARSQTVMGVDVSPAMLDQARKNCKKYGAASVSPLNVDEMDTLEPASFDLVHSFIVLQHIPVARGELILRKLIALLAEGGVGAIHFNYGDNRTALQRGVMALRQRVSLVRGVLNLRRHLPFSTPPMQMNSYSMNRIFDILIDEHCSNVYVEFSAHGGFRGAMIYFEKRPGPLL
jgi:SAM-dependent methyltransferase